MNITYLIGNGFDINLGLDTRFTDFYKYYLKIESPNEFINKFKENELIRNAEKWADLELELGKYMQEYTENELDDIINLLIDLQNNLCDYLDLECKKISNYQIYKEKIIHDLFNPEIYLDSRQKQNLSSYKSSFNAQNHNINIITFNYTKTIENILSWNNLKIQCSERKYDNKTLSNNLLTIEHIHGTTEDSMLLGVNDSDQINNNTLKNNNRLRYYLVKTVMNVNTGSRREEICNTRIHESDLIVVFGMSIGKTDKYWWETVLKRISGSNARLIIYYKTEEIPKRRIQIKQLYIDDVYKILQSYVNINNINIDAIKSKIFVSINSEMFSFKEVKFEQEVILKVS